MLLEAADVAFKLNQFDVAITVSVKALDAGVSVRSILAVLEAVPSKEVEAAASRYGEVLMRQAWRPSLAMRLSA